MSKDLEKRAERNHLEAEARADDQRIEYTVVDTVVGRRTWKQLKDAYEAGEQAGYDRGVEFGYENGYYEGSTSDG